MPFIGHWHCNIPCCGTLPGLCIVKSTSNHSNERRQPLVARWPSTTSLSKSLFFYRKRSGSTLEHSAKTTIYYQWVLNHFTDIKTNRYHTLLLVSTFLPMSSTRDINPSSLASTKKKSSLRRPLQVIRFRRAFVRPGRNNSDTLGRHRIMIARYLFPNFEANQNRRRERDTGPQARGASRHALNGGIE